MNTSSFVSTMATFASRANHANLAAACSVLHLIRENGGTNAKASKALWALLPDETVTTFAQVKRVSGAINNAKPTDGAKQVRSIWLESISADDMTDRLIAVGIVSPRSLLDLVAPRKDKEDKADKETSAVETFLSAAKAEGFKEDVTPLLVWIAEKHAEAMQALLEQAQAFQAGVLKDAAAKNADIEAKAKKAKAAKDAKTARDAERTRLNAEKIAEAEKLESDAKSTKAKQAHAEKVARERATHPKVRAIIEA